GQSAAKVLGTVQFFRGLHVPVPHCPIHAAREEFAVIGQECHRVRITGMARVRANFRATREIPQPEAAIVAAGGECIAASMRERPPPAPTWSPQDPANFAYFLRRWPWPFNRYSHNHGRSHVVFHTFDEFDLLNDLGGVFRLDREIPDLIRYVI